MRACVHACVLGDSVDSFIFEKSCSIHSDSSSSFTLSVKLFHRIMKLIYVVIFLHETLGIVVIICV